ncbi:twin-arginine translocation pathway signal protein, partial [Vibrio alfacsensis]
YYSELCVDAEDKFVEFRAIFEDDDDYGFDLDTSIGKQLRVVFLLLRARDEFQQPAQFFSVTLGGFDTHSAQEAEQGAL